MTQGDLFVDGQELVGKPKPVDRRPRELTVMITVKAAPQPSQKYGETVCLAGVSMDLNNPEWIRLYPINFRDLDETSKFAKYSVVTLRAKPAPNDPRAESWCPELNTVRTSSPAVLNGPRRWSVIDPYVSHPMCELQATVNDEQRRRKQGETGLVPSPSLGLVRAARVDGLKIAEHPGWTPQEQSKIEQWARQGELFDGHTGEVSVSASVRFPLQAPKVRAWYLWHCEAEGCRGHEQGLLDWEFVALQRRLVADGADGPDLHNALRARFLEEMCGPERYVCFYVGNQAKRQQTFSVLGVYTSRRERPARR